MQSVNQSLASFINQYIEYFRRCYRADSSDLLLWNIGKIRADRKYEVEGHDVLASDELPAMPAVRDSTTALAEQADTYRKERMLIYGCMMISGNIKTSSGFTNERKIFAPLLYFPASLSDDEIPLFRITQNDLRINWPLIRQLLKPELEPEYLDRFPDIQWPLDTSDIAGISRWLSQYSIVSNPEELIRWPMLNSPEEIKSLMKGKKDVRVFSAASFLLADRSRGSRGVLHELKELAGNENGFSAPLLNLLSQPTAAIPGKVSDPDTLPGYLSLPQQAALKNASSFPLSMVSGPPGTGKSYTVASMATDRILKGESVLIVSGGDQALDVVAQLLRTEFGLSSGIVKANDQSASGTMKQYLSDILASGLPADDRQASGRHRELKSLRNTLKIQERTFLNDLKRQRKISKALFASEGRLSEKIQAIKYRFFCEAEKTWKFPDSLRLLQGDINQLSKEYVDLYRSGILRNLLNTQRKTLSLFEKALRARNSKTQHERFSQLNLSVLLDAFPVWLVNSSELNQIIPMEKELFDLVIFDEASQCDIATALPALQRAKRAVIVGDVKQLRHVSFLSGKKQKQIEVSTGMNNSPVPVPGYRETSLLDLTCEVIPTQEAVTLLDEHYRSRSDLISFSNHHFYHNRLKLMRRKPIEANGLELRYLKNGERNKHGRNEVECDALIECLREILHNWDDQTCKLSVGILSPYRDQADYLEERVLASLSSDERDRFRIKVATPFGFQGEERDVMLLSMVVDSNASRSAAYLNREDMFNVAVTRSKDRQIVFYSVLPDHLPAGNMLQRYLSFSHSQNDAEHQDVRCRFADEASEVLAAEGICCWQGYAVANQVVDIVYELNGKLVGIDLVGVPGVFEDYFDTDTYRSLFRAGLPVIPVSYAMWKLDRDACMNRIRGELSE